MAAEDDALHLAEGIIATVYCVLSLAATLVIFIRTRMRLDISMILISIAYLAAFGLRIQLGLFSKFLEALSLSIAFFVIDCTIYYFVFEMRKLMQ